MKSRQIIEEKDFIILDLTLPEGSKEIELPLYEGSSVKRDQAKGKVSIKYPNTPEVREQLIRYGLMKESLEKNIEEPPPVSVQEATEEAGLHQLLCFRSRRQN